jgi:hypothetical protein
MALIVAYSSLPLAAESSKLIKLFHHATRLYVQAGPYYRSLSSTVIAAASLYLLFSCCILFRICRSLLTERSLFLSVTAQPCFVFTCLHRSIFQFVRRSWTFQNAYPYRAPKYTIKCASILNFFQRSSRSSKNMAWPYDSRFENDRFEQNQSTPTFFTTHRSGLVDVLRYESENVKIVLLVCFEVLISKGLPLRYILLKTIIYSLRSVWLQGGRCGRLGRRP